MYPLCYKGDKQDRFAVQFLDDQELTNILDTVAKPQSTVKLEGAAATDGS
jgi:hypothetical protein